MNTILFDNSPNKHSHQVIVHINFLVGTTNIQYEYFSLKKKDEPSVRDLGRVDVCNLALKSTYFLSHQK